ncbi:AAA domain-containing protein [Bacillus paranthracis]|uniref:AAA family ATPase n=1 Tax=Bacillus cereus group TaxID=86661 RepID=UPI00148EF7F0|nr:MULTISPECIES: AAA family ATPase [Bacillus cereus group]MDA1510778.1 AAA family ATPase [Bacillus cereus group sp. TH36-2LC]MDA1893396.1 AAA family ATPase [Bacillus cereus group sp. BY11-1LC]MDA1901828.1 AAA family ATPase [Bacillus cereus group sp. BcHK20]NOP82393.1 AAA domain-containing protein [Bacillus paranthracis]
MILNQANPDGTIEQGDCPNLELKYAVGIIKNAIEKNDGNISVVRDTNTGESVTEIEYDPRGSAILSTRVRMGTAEKDLNIHIRNILNSGVGVSRPSPNDRRIQCSPQRLRGLFKEESINLLLSVYRRKGVSIIIGWDFVCFAKKNANNVSPKVNVRTIAEAMRDGIAFEARQDEVAVAFRKEMFSKYLLNLNVFHRNENSVKLVPPHKITENVPRNRIVSGAPGTGKSSILNDKAKRLFQYTDHIKRVTFYPRYSYSHFVGSYKPIPMYKETDITIYKANMIETFEYNLEPIIDYQFEPGPLIELYCLAKKHPDTDFLLIIEEINRANPAEVFGDFFQLLDRNDQGESKYSITINPAIMNYIKANIFGFNEIEIKIPSNLYIWATMNNGDQGIQPMDTAFKRRWNFEYIGIDDNEQMIVDWELNIKCLGRKVFWNKLRKLINKYLLSASFSEDKLLGPFFLHKHELEIEDIFTDKILYYLKEDVLRYNPGILFRYDSFSEISKLSKVIGNKVFTDEFQVELEKL